MRTLGIIPARYNSSRFPGKPLIDILGKTMIRRVYEQATSASGLDEVIVATDDEQILLHVNSFGGRAIMTSGHHQSGTDRCAEVIEKIPGFDIVVNVQGDEPFIDPRQINLVCTCFEDTTTVIATLVKKISSAEEITNPNLPKVVLNNRNEAVYFSRSTIPFLRDPSQEYISYYKHIGIYAYRADTLLQITKLPVSQLERAEALEQLRWIENGYCIKVAVTDIETLAIDTPGDLKKIVAMKSEEIN